MQPTIKVNLESTIESYARNISAFKKKKKNLEDRSKEKKMFCCFVSINYTKIIF